MPLSSPVHRLHAVSSVCLAFSLLLAFGSAAPRPDGDFPPDDAGLADGGVGRAPDTQILAGPPSQTEDSDATFTFTSPTADVVFECSLDETAYGPCTSPHMYSALEEGAHTFGVRAVSTLTGATDSSPATYAWAIGTAPDTEITSSPATQTGSTDASFEFIAIGSASSFECAIDTAAFSTCTSPATYSGLAFGAHEFSVRAVSSAGLIDATPATFLWSILDNVPETQITEAPPTTTLDTTATFAFLGSGEVASYECRLDEAEFAACTSPVTFDDVTTGTHTFQVRALNDMGIPDASPASHTWTVEEPPAPNTTVNANFFGSATNNTTVTFNFNYTDWLEMGVTFECDLTMDAAEPVFAACTSPATYADLADGQYTFTVRAVAADGNADPTPATRVFTIDTVTPSVTIDSSPPLVSSSAVADFTFSSDETTVSFDCQLDGGEVESCSSPKSYTGLGDGPHTFLVWVEDYADNANPTPAEYTWSVDTPNTMITNWPPAATASTSATFDFISNNIAAPTFECSLDAAAYVACAPPYTLTGLAAGPHELTVRSIDTGIPDPTPTTSSWSVVVGPWTSVISTGLDTCSLDSSGDVYCWGGSEDVTVSQETTGAGLVELDVASNHRCGVDGAGALFCWGVHDERLGLGTTSGDPVLVPTQVTLPGPVQRFTVGKDYSCAITTDLSLYCWGLGGAAMGLDETAPVDAPALVDAGPWIDVQAASDHTCGVKADGTLWCWGDGGRELGLDTDTTAKLVPTRVGLTTDWARLAHFGDYDAACAHRSDGELFCWGNDSISWGLCGLGSNVPETVEDEAYSAATVGGFLCMLDGAGGLTCCGDNDSFVIGVQDADWFFPDPATPQPDLDGTVASVATGSYHGCLTTFSGELLCWGENTDGQLGQGSHSTAEGIVAVALTGTVESISMGFSSACAVRADNTAACWGGNEDGQLGVGDQLIRRVPSAILDDHAWDKALVGSVHGCGIEDAGTLWCWGHNGYGQLGAPELNSFSSSVYSEPRQAGIFDDWIDVSAYSASSCGVRSDGTLWCWGRGANGQLGLGMIVEEVVEPTRVGMDADWDSVVMAGRFACALKSDASLWCWGENDGGQLGVGDTLERLEPTQVPGTWLAVDAYDGNNEELTCGVQSDDTLWCWGDAFDVLGASNVASPQQQGTDVDWDSISVGYRYACGLRAEPGLPVAAYCMGSNFNGQLGIDDADLPPSSTTPAPVTALSVEPAMVETGAYATCAVGVDGSAWCWGYNGLGQLGDGTGPSQVALPVPHP